MQRTVHEYLKALEAGDADKAASLFIPDGWVESPFLGRLPVRQFIKKVAESSKGTRLTVHDVLVSAEGHLRAVASTSCTVSRVPFDDRSEEHTSELQSPMYLVCRLLLEQK